QPPLPVPFPRFRYANRNRWRLDQRFRPLLLGLLNPPLDFTNVVDVLAELRAILGAKAALKVLHAFTDGVEDAVVLFQAGQSLFSRRAVAAEHPLEHHSRIDFHRQRLRRRAPGDRAHVRAEKITGAAPEMA